MGDEIAGPSHVQQDEGEFDVTQLSSDKIASMSMEELRQLKQKLRGVISHEVTENLATNPRMASQIFKRENKNRPRETSSKVRERRQGPKIVRRDPRFEEASGTFNEREFRKAYKFLDDVREKEKKIITKKMKKEKDPEKKEILQKIKQRLENQEREKRKKEQEDEMIHNLQQKAMEETGRSYLRKSEIKSARLVQKFQSLKKSGKLQKYLEKKRKKNVMKERKKGPFG